jgi:(1->4)-alpha-D-glucan 1-alpha-D-glucosylmutase
MPAFRCTYRLQLGPGLGFREAAALVPYLRDLGVSHLYLPPSFQAREGSTHGYDVVDPTAISAELGGEEAFDALVAAVRGAGLGVILDIVPNHMATDDANRYWTEERARFFDVDEATGRYRRFFDIDHLAGVRQEDPEVFAETHRLALRLVREGVVDGLRIDHPDGLADPAGYLQRLRDGGAEHVWVEKILDPGEHLRADWPVEGTVGYEFLVDVAALLVDPAGEAPMTALHAELTGERRPFAAVAAEAKLEQATTTFAPDVERLDRVHREPDVHRKLAALPVYRTYAVGGVPSDEDRDVLEEAGLGRDFYDGKPAEWVTRFQQTTPPVMAKGVEDTAFYRYGRLLALNDVGGDPSRFSLGVEAFHAANAERAERFPHNLLVTQTHDTKRSGDVRARIGALAGMVDAWGAFARRWIDGAVDAPTQWFVLQTLLGAWPIEEDRLTGYLEKALREAKVGTNWIDPDEDYERRVQGWATGLLADAAFLADFEPLHARVAEAGHRAALAQLALKLTAPGLADLYQGDELVALSLVDPDNRRAVDWERRRRLLDAVRAGTAEPSRDAEKLALVVDALDVRARREAAFAGAYTPVDAGPDVCAYLRGSGAGEEVLVVAVLREAGQDAQLALPGGPVAVRDVTGGRAYAVVER